MVLPYSIFVTSFYMTFIYHRMAESEIEKHKSSSQFLIHPRKPSKGKLSNTTSQTQVHCTNKIKKKA